jgi:hypothetical protein
LSDEAEFNIYAAGEFVTEYERETGQSYRVKRVGTPFPDVVLEACDGREVGLEFVSLVLAFINRENSYFDGYRRAFLNALQIQRPRYGRVKITLQPHHEYVEKNRPIRFPDIHSLEGRQLVTDFASLLNDRFGDLSTRDAGKDGHALFDELRNIDGTLSYRTLSKYFGGVLFHHMTAPEASAHKVPLDEPVIADPVVWYSNAEIPKAIRQALKTKTEKGAAYSTEMLTLHTLPKSGVADVSGIGMNANEITQLGREVLAATPALKTRFQ